MPKKSPKRKKTPRAAHVRRGSFHIILVDQAPLRRDAASECARLASRIEKTRGEWEHFETRDLPAFDRWMAATFGALLTRSRELGALLGEKESLVQEIEEEMFITGANPRTAYRRVMHYRANPPGQDDDNQHGWGAPPKNDHEFRPGNPGGHDEPDEIDQEMLFQELLRSVMGINPDKLGDSAYDRMFREFKKEAFGNGGSLPPPRNRSSASRARAPKTEQARIKEIYRTLVRRLHPDLRADGNTAVSSLWHEVQEAYERGNLERLETLLALTDLQSSQIGSHTSLFQMRAVIVELERDLKALQKSLRRARKNDAWNFTQAGDRRALHARISGELQATLNKDEQRLRELEALLAAWASPSSAGRRGQRASGTQGEFRF